MTTFMEQSLGEEYLKPDWKRFYGNNHERIDAGGNKQGGGFRLSSYLGRLLSQELWDSLVYQLGIQEIRIFRPNDLEWTIGYGTRGISLYLDEQDKLVDFYLQI